MPNPTTTTLQLVKRRLVELITASWGSGANVSYMYPGADNAGNEAMYFGKTIDGLHTYTAIKAGRKPRDEVYTCKLHIDVFKPSGTAEQAETRALELFAMVENIIANDPKLGLSEIWLTKVDEWELHPGFNEEGEGVQMVVDINVEARLS